MITILTWHNLFLIILIFIWNIYVFYKLMKIENELTRIEGRP